LRQQLRQQLRDQQLRQPQPRPCGVTISSPSDALCAPSGMLLFVSAAFNFDLTSSAGTNIAFNCESGTL